MARLEGYPVADVGNVGSGDGGLMVHFELVDPTGKRMQFLSPIKALNKILLALNTALEMARTEAAKRPGFSLSEYGTRVGLKSYAIGVAMLPTQISLVGLHLETKSPALALDLMLKPDEAEKLGNALIQGALEARATRPRKPS